VRLESKADLDPLAFRVLQDRMEDLVSRAQWEMQVRKVLMVSWALVAHLAHREAQDSLASRAQGEMSVFQATKERQDPKENLDLLVPRDRLVLRERKEREELEGTLGR